MLNVSTELKTLYKAPSTPKVYDIYFPSLDLHINTAGKNDKIVHGSFELSESICTDEQLKFGKCNAAQLKFTLVDIADDIKGKELSITQTVIADEETSHDIPFGYFTVSEAKKKDDLRFKDIVTYDRMRRIDVDVSAWYNSLTFPITLSAFRASFLAHIGLEEDISKLPLPNDSMDVNKTIETNQLNGRTVIEACEELNGCFGLIGRDGKFTHIILKRMHHDYPQADYPGSDYPETEPYDEYLDNYEGIHFEEYRVQPIDKIQIRQEENDVGAIYGTGTNCYIIQGNFLVFGKSAEELQIIAQNASVNIFDRGYRPYTAKGVGLPYIMPGDFIKYNADDTTAGYVFSRTLTGIQALQDEYEAKGTEKQEQNFSIRNEIIQQKGRMTKIEKSVEGVRAEVTDLEKEVSSEFELIAGQAVLKVDTNGNIGYVQLTGDPDTDLTSIVLKADNLSLEGLTTINGNFRVLLDGTIEAVDGKFSGDITASEFIGGVARSANYYSGVSGMMIDLYNGTLDTPNFYIGIDGKIRAVNGEFVTSGANGSVTIKDGKITLKNSLLQATAEFDGSDMWIDYIVVRETANFTKDVNFQLRSAPTLSIGGVPQSFVTSANLPSYLYWYVTSTELSNAMGVLDNAIKSWVSSNFQPKA